MATNQTKAIRCAARPSRLRQAWCCSIMSTLVFPLQAISAERQLDQITVEAKRKERAELQRQVDQFVDAAVVHHFGESLMRWDTPVCPLVAGVPLNQGEFMLRRLSQAARDAGAPLAPEQCTANFFVLVTSQADRILEDLRKKAPGLFDTKRGVGTLRHFLLTERPIRVWYNWQNHGDPGAGLAVVAAFTGGSGTMGGVTGMPSPSAVGADGGGFRMPNSRLTLTATKFINTAIIVVDLPRMKGINVGQLADYAAMVGLAEINLDKLVLSAPSVLRLFSEPSEAPVDGMSPWDQALLKSLYATPPKSVTQLSEIKTHMVDSIASH
jgi:hypothetical protein